MRRLAYILYVVSVLLISGLARAHADSLSFNLESTYQVAINISQVSINNDGNLQLLIQGFLPNRCFGHPAVTLTQNPAEPNVFTLHVLAAAPPADIDCELNRQEYSTLIDLPTLVAAGQFKLNDKETYLIKTDGYPFSTAAVGVDLLRRKK